MDIIFDKKCDFMAQLPNKEFHQLVPKLREKGFYPSQKPRDIKWPIYNQNEIDNIIEVLDFIRNSVDAIKLPSREGKTGRPLTNPHSLAKAILLCEELHLDERNAQGWLNILGPRVGITEHLDDRVIGDASTKPEVIHILKKVFENTKDSNGTLAGDGTGLESTRKQNYESTKKKEGTYMTSIVDTREIVQAFDISGTQECRIMHDLITQVKGKILTLDAGFVDRKLVAKIAELSMTPFVFPKKSVKLNGRPAWKLMYLTLFNNVLDWLITYHQRSHTESFHSSFKRTNGPVTKRRPTSLLSQITARIILHNRRKLSYFNKVATQTT